MRYYISCETKKTKKEKRKENPKLFQEDATT